MGGEARGVEMVAGRRGEGNLNGRIVGSSEQ